MDQDSFHLYIFEGRRKTAEPNRACYSSLPTLNHAYRLLVVLVTTDEGQTKSAATVDLIERILEFAPENPLE